MLNNFRDYYIRNAHAMLKRKLTRDEIVKLTDRGLERALYPERYPQKEEETDENAKLDLKDEKDIEDAVKGMLKKFNFGYLVEEAESRVGRAPAPSSAPTQPQTTTLGQHPASQPLTSDQGTAAGHPEQEQVKTSSSTAPNVALSQATQQSRAPDQAASIPSQLPANGSVNGQTPGPTPTQHPSLPRLTEPAKSPMSLNTPNDPQTGQGNTAQIQPPTGTATSFNPVSAHPPVPQQAPTPAPTQALPPRANGTSTPVPPPVEALTPLGGSPKPGTPVSATPSAPASGSFAGKRPSPAPGPKAPGGTKRSLDGDATVENEVEAKKPKVEG